MIFGNLTNVLENEQTIYEAVQHNIGNKEIKKPTKWSRVLTSLSNYGMNYTDDVIKNMQAVPADKKLQDKNDPILQDTLFSQQMNNWKIKPEEEKNFVEKTLDIKRETLRKMAMQPELEDILDVMANECIVYDDNEAYIAQPFLDTALIQDLNEKSADETKAAIDTAFYKMYMLLEWKRKAWDDFKRYLIDGVICYEIVYDNLEHPKSIIGLIDLDPCTLTIDVKDGITYWVQFKDVIGRERWLLDSQVIYVKYEDSGVAARQSYLERLIRPFNLYRIVEQAQVIWTVTQSSFKTMFTIPVAGMNKAKGLQTLNAAMNRYKEDISFNIDTGELKVNGKMNMPFNKEYWMPENENGKPEIEQLVDNGPTLNDSDQLKYFEQKLYKMSKIPSSRFDQENQQTWFGSDATQQLRDEINFGRFVGRLRNTFAEIILKPLRIQLTLSIPGLKNDKRILDAVSLKFNSYNQFEEMMEIATNEKRMEFIQTIREAFLSTDSEGNEERYFCDRFLIERYLRMSDADLELNEKYKEQEKALKNAKQEGDEEEDTDEEGENLLDGDDSGAGDSGEGGGDVDSEMMGDVQPESTETTQA